MRKVDPIGLAKAILWEEAKGKLRALVMADGSDEGGESRVSHGTIEPHFFKVHKAVETFIKDFEGEGYHE